MSDLPDEAKTETVEYEYEGETRTLVVYDHGEVKSILRACLQSYEDPETGMSGVEMVEKATEAVEHFPGQPLPGQVHHLAALRRLLHDPEGGCQS